VASSVFAAEAVGTSVGEGAGAGAEKIPLEKSKVLRRAMRYMLSKMG
jgi:hypothetical protein